MPYGDDQWLEDIKNKRTQALIELAEGMDYYTREHLKERFNIPDEFMDLAVKIWLDGKED